jgi:DNA-binding MarR family transcriptional regulator
LKPEETFDFHIKRTWQSIAKMYNEVASSYGVSMATGFVLLNIDLSFGTPSTALGPKMGMESTSLSRLLKSMEEKNLIERKPNPEDGRGVLIFLTNFGKEKRLDARAAVINFNEALRKQIAPEKAAVFFEVIEDIHQFINQTKEEVEPK